MGACGVRLGRKVRPQFVRNPPTLSAAEWNRASLKRSREICQPGQASRTRGEGRTPVESRWTLRRCTNLLLDTQHSHRRRSRRCRRRSRRHRRRRSPGGGSTSSLMGSVRMLPTPRPAGRSGLSAVVGRCANARSYPRQTTHAPPTPRRRRSETKLVSRRNMSLFGHQEGER